MAKIGGTPNSTSRDSIIDSISNESNLGTEISKPSNVGDNARLCLIINS